MTGKSSFESRAERDVVKHDSEHERVDGFCFVTRDASQAVKPRGYGIKIVKAGPGVWVCSMLDTDLPVAIAWNGRKLSCGHMRYVRPGRRFPSKRPCQVCADLKESTDNAPEIGDANPSEAGGEATPDPGVGGSV